MITKLALMAGAGAAGMLCRFGMGELVKRLYGGVLPFGTLAVNVLGCFLFGAFWAYACARPGVSVETRTIVLVGFMGAFTTFSSFVFDTYGLIENARYAWAAGNILVQNIVGIASVMLGIAVCRAT